MTCGVAAADETFQRVDVTDWQPLSVEKRGSTPATWLQDPANKMVRWLHKDTMIPESGNEQGEDWSEVFSTLVACELGVPVAPVRLCARGGRRGSLSRNVRPEGVDLYEGLVVLEQCSDVVGYFAHRESAPGVDPDRPGVKRPGHTLENIRLALAGIGAPPGFSGPRELGGFDVFVGYLVLDALIANRDRHEENWAVLRPQLTGPAEQLAPSYDHASSLGYNLLDRARTRMMEDTASLERWARGGTAYRFEHEGKPTTLVDLVVVAFGLCSDSAREHWKARVADLNLDVVYDALDRRAVPEMSEAACRFAGALLHHNHGRLRDAVVRA